MLLLLLFFFAAVVAARHADGSVGFVQMDVSINPEVKDVRVLSFEDRHDCMKCLTVLRQWPEMVSAQLSVGAVQSDVVEQEIRWAAAAAAGCFLAIIACRWSNSCFVHLGDSDFERHAFLVAVR